VPGFSPVGDRDYRPGLASGWTWGADSLTLRFTLDSTARWHDGRPVTSRDVAFTLAVLRDSATGTVRGSDIAMLVDSVTTPDPRTAVVWARRRAPALFHHVTYDAPLLPAHLLDSVPRGALHTHPLNRHPVGSGPFRLAGWAAREHVDLVATHPEAGRVGRVLVRVLPDYQAAVATFAAGKADVLNYVRAEDAARLARRADVRILRLPVYDYAFLQFNLRAPNGKGIPHPLFGDRGLRRALAMAVDRRAIVANVLDTLGYVALGPVTRAQATADTTLLAPAYDPAAASALLDSLGWRVRGAADRTPFGTAVRRRHGRRLSFALVVPSSSANRVRAAVLLQRMLAEVGADVRIEQYDAATVQAALEAGRFDAALNGLRVDVDPAGVRDVWGGAAGRTGHGFNYGGYASANVDRLVDSAGRTMDPAAAAALYRRAYQRIIDDAPAIFLYEPVSLVAVRARLRPARVRADAWWAGLADWTAAPRRAPTP
jgi:peptide/nickel transport system substrate-binding protein